MKKIILGIFISVLLFVLGCAGAPSVPAPRFGDPENPYDRAASGRGGVVAAAKPLSSEIGVEILRRGGNAVDAAVAVGFANGVIEPEMNGLGGGGFMLIKLAGMPEAVFIDFRSTAPAAATTNMFIAPDNTVREDARRRGGEAVAVPGQVKGLLYALENFGSGRLSRQELIQPAIDLAYNGFEVTENFQQNILSTLDVINTFPATSELFTDFGLPLEAGDIIRNPDLARTLQLIAAHGADGFHRGPIAEKIVQAVQEAGGILTREDMANYRVVSRRPVVGTYRGYTIITAPPPSTGGIQIIQILNMLENLHRRDLQFGTPRAVNAWIHALRLASADRFPMVADPDFVSIPVTGLLSKDYARERFALFDLNTAMLTARSGNPRLFETTGSSSLFDSEDPILITMAGYCEYLGGSTTSFSVMDSAGNMVTVTKTINSFFGSGVAVPGAGVLMNNDMVAFTARPGNVNSVAPHKRPRSFMTPTIVLDPRGRPFMTVGSPGAARIVAAVSQIISNVIDNDMSIQDAIAAPRWHSITSGSIYVEGRIPAATVDALRSMGYDVRVLPEWDLFFGGAQGVILNHRTRVLHGGADPRRDGEARAF